MNRAALELVDAYPLLALNAPGAPATVMVELNAASSGTVELTAELLDNGVQVAIGRTTATLSSGSNEAEVLVDVPAAEARGYQVRVTAADASGEGVPQVTSTALLAASHWRHVPRYGFVSEFVPDDPAAGPTGSDRVRELAKFHITIVQFYDWMYRHYRFQPPLGADGEPPNSFTDAMGREVSPQVVAQRVDDCHQHGMAAIAYGAVYGPEPEFILERPDWMLYDAAGAPLHLIELFYITDLRPGGWREHILRELETAITDIGFDGIHMDQYGFPKLAYDSKGALVDPSVDFPSMIDEAAARVRRVKPSAGVIFNAVNDWPIDTVAPSDQEAVYIEVWSPHDSYRDLVDLIRRARDLSGKQTILSAYLQPFHEGGAGAEWALRYITAVIAAAGGHHLVLGEGTAVLREPYYPDHGQLSTAGVRIARRYYDHTAAFTHYLHAHDLRPVARNFTTGINTAFRLDGAPATAVPAAGAVWLNVAQRPGQFVLNLVNLTGVTDDSWNVAQPAAPLLNGLSIVCEPFVRVVRVTWASPDDAVTAGSVGEEPGSWAHAGVFATELEPRVGDDGAVTIELPPLSVWATVLLEVEPGETP